MQVIYDPNEQRIPIMAWLDEIDAGTLEQSRNLAKLPFAARHIALMPNAHLGYGIGDPSPNLLPCWNSGALLRTCHAVP